MAEARRLRHPLRAASYEALFGLLAVSGMRIGEAIALEREDVDLDAGLITIRKAKHDRARLVPLHPTATEALRRYASERDRLCPTTALARVLSLQRRHRPCSRVACARRSGRSRPGSASAPRTVHPRIHDLRHRFAVQTLIDWQRSGVNIDEHIATLSTYLGHVSPADTYWYLSASPELMALAADRLARPVRRRAMSALAPAMQAYFTDRLVAQRGASPNTIAAYCQTFRLLLALRRPSGPASRPASWTSPSSTRR